MATQDLSARLLLEAETTGGNNLRALADELEALSKEGGEAAPKFDQLAQSLRELDAQDRAIAGFSALRREVADTAADGRGGCQRRAAGCGVPVQPAARAAADAQKRPAAGARRASVRPS